MPAVRDRNKNTASAPTRVQPDRSAKSKSISSVLPKKETKKSNRRNKTTSASSRIQKKSKPLKTQPTAAKEAETCAICLENIAERQSAKIDCSHTFHRKCIKAWIDVPNASLTCPNCRASVTFMQCGSKKTVVAAPQPPQPPVDNYDNDDEDEDGEDGDYLYYYGDAVPPRRPRTMMDDFRDRQREQSSFFGRFTFRPSSVQSLFPSIFGSLWNG